MEKFVHLNFKKKFQSLSLSVSLSISLQKWIYPKSSGFIEWFLQLLWKSFSFYFRFYYFFNVFTDFCLSSRLLSGLQFLLTNNIKQLRWNTQKTNTIIQKISSSILSSFVKTVAYKIRQISKSNVFLILYLNKKL